MCKKVAIFSGSFNPIHIGHLALANFVVESKVVDELWFMVSPQNPLKETQDLLSDEIRLELVQLAIKGYPKFKASDFEFTLPQPSYTIRTLKALKETYPSYEFHLLIGADNWLIFNQWKDYHHIIANFHLLIYPRLGYDIKKETLPKQLVLVDSPVMEVSSTFIRNSIKQGKDYRYFLHPEVFKYIKEHQLYLNTSNADE